MHESSVGCGCCMRSGGYYQDRPSSLLVVDFSFDVPFVHDVHVCAAEGEPRRLRTRFCIRQILDWFTTREGPITSLGDFLLARSCFFLAVVGLIPVDYLQAIPRAREGPYGGWATDLHPHVSSNAGSFAFHPSGQSVPFLLLFLPSLHCSVDPNFLPLILPSIAVGVPVFFASVCLAKCFRLCIYFLVCLAKCLCVCLFDLDRLSLSHSACGCVQQLVPWVVGDPDVGSMDPGTSVEIRLTCPTPSPDIFDPVSLPPTPSWEEGTSLEHTCPRGPRPFRTRDVERRDRWSGPDQPFQVKGWIESKCLERSDGSHHVGVRRSRTT